MNAEIELIKKKKPPVAESYWKVTAAGGILFNPECIADDFLRSQWVFDIRG